MLYKNQTLVDLELETGVPLAGATVKKIIMTRPDNTRTELDAGYNGTKLIFNNPAGVNNFSQEGQYKFQGRFIVDGREGFTSVVKVLF